eukprot:5033066-Prymnesium_polylepis.1
MSVSRLTITPPIFAVTRRRTETARPLPERPHRPLRSLSCHRVVAPITVLVAAAVACTAEPA